MGNTTMCSECSSMPFNVTKYFKIPIYSIVVAAGLPLNCLALWALVHQIKRSVVLSVYIMNLLLANVLQILTLPFWMYYSYHNHHWGLGGVMCVVVGLAFRTNFYAKNNFLCLIAMERYIGIVHPLKFHKLQTTQGAIRMCIFTWLLVGTLCAIGIGLQVEGSKAECCLDAFPLNYVFFKVATISFSFFIPLVLMGFFYFSILFELRKVASLERRVRRQIYGFVSLILASFFLLFIPFHVTSCYKYSFDILKKNVVDCSFEENMFIYSHVTVCLTTLGNILDPLLYILILKDIRIELISLLSFRARKTEILFTMEQQDLPPHTTTGQMQDQTGTQEGIH
ncbi:G-protein coupled receptor 4-like [Hemicordylus capensis]|uniref:G-protein coupled receptor 4-like n=1 Tax=Hemicordylus capensis TaxID=884348 RepID=UPI0023048329|nr:G-protein coupled receptor 4-like [Hemicordylus capensis]